MHLQSKNEFFYIFFIIFILILLTEEDSTQGIVHSILRKRADALDEISSVPSEEDEQISTKHWS